MTQQNVDSVIDKITYDRRNVLESVLFMFQHIRQAFSEVLFSQSTVAPVYMMMESQIFLKGIFVTRLRRYWCCVIRINAFTKEFIY